MDFYEAILADPTAVAGETRYGYYIVSVAADRSSAVLRKAGSTAPVALARIAWTGEGVRRVLPSFSNWRWANGTWETITAKFDDNPENGAIAKFNGMSWQNIIVRWEEPIAHVMLWLRETTARGGAFNVRISHGTSWTTGRVDIITDSDLRPEVDSITTQLNYALTGGPYSFVEVNLGSGATSGTMDFMEALGIAVDGTVAEQAARLAALETKDAEFEASRAQAAADAAALTTRVKALEDKPVADASLAAKVAAHEANNDRHVSPVFSFALENAGAAVPTVVGTGTLSARAISAPAEMPGTAVYAALNGPVRFSSTFSGAVGDVIEVSIANRSATPNAFIRIDPAAGQRAQSVLYADTLSGNDDNTTTWELSGDWRIMRRVFTLDSATLTVGAVVSDGHVFAGPFFRKRTVTGVNAVGLPLALRSELPSAPDLSPYAKTADLPSASNPGIWARKEDLAPFIAPHDVDSYYSLGQTVLAENGGLYLVLADQRPAKTRPEDDTTNYAFYKWASQRFQSATAERDTGTLWTDGKAVFERVFTGTMPTTAVDTTLFTVTGATSILSWFGHVTQTGGTAGRRSLLDYLPSGDATHGAAFQFYGNVAHLYWSVLPDARYRGPATYSVTVRYVK